MTWKNRKRLAMVRIQLRKTLKYLLHVGFTNKNRNFDTMRIKVAVLSFCQKALISRGFWLLSAPAATR